MVRTLVPSAQAARGGRLPDFVLVGAPKAGTTALHAALAQHPELFLSRVKEPKYYLCGDSPPPAYRGPGDAHSNREWVWQRQAYLDLFEGANEDQLAGESAPFYLCHRDARRRIVADLPDGQLAPVRDPERGTRLIGPVVRAGARAGQFLPPQHWRRLSGPLIERLHHRGDVARPKLTPEQRVALRRPFLEDIGLLEEVTGRSYDEWRVHRDGDSFATRQSQRVSG